MADWNLKTQQQGVFYVGKGLSTYEKLYEGSRPNTGLYITGPDGKEYVYVPKEFTAKGLEYEPLNSYNKPAGYKTQHYNNAYLNPKTFENAYSFKLPEDIKKSSFFTSADFDGITNYADINKSGEGFLFPADYYNSTIKWGAGEYKTSYKNDKGEWTQLTEPLKGVGKLNERIAAVNGLDPNQPVYLAGSKQPDSNTAIQFFVSPTSGGLQEKGIVVTPGKSTWFGIGGVIGDVMGGIAQTIRDLGPIGQIGMMYATAGLGEMVGSQLGIGSLAGSAIVNGAMQVAQGKDIEDALTGAAKTIAIGSAAGEVSNSVLGEAAAEKYATDVGSQQSNMLAAQEAGMGTLKLNDVLGTGANISADLASRVAGQTAGSILAGNDIMSALTTGGINLGVPLLTSQIPGFDKLDPKLQRAASTVIANELQGKDPSQALINQAIQIGMDAVKTNGKNLSTNYAANLAAEGIDPDTFDAAELNFGTGTNQLTDQDLVNIINGGIGDATLTGGAKTDTFVGPPLPPGFTQTTTQDDLVNIINGGQDSVSGGEATTQGGAATDTIQSGAATDTIQSGQDSITSGSANTPADGQLRTVGPRISRGSDGSYVVNNDWENRYFADTTSPTGFVSVNGVPVNSDGTLWVDPNTKNTTDTQTGGQDTGTTLTGNDGSTLTINSDGSVSSTDATDLNQSTLTGGSGATDTITGGTTTQPNIEYHADGSYTVTYEDGTSAVFNADGTPYSTKDDTGTNTISVYADDTSPSSFRDSLGNPVNADGTPYVAQTTGADTLTGGSSTVTGGGSGGQPAVPPPTNPVITPGTPSAPAAPSRSGLDLGALLALMGGGSQQTQPTQPALADTSGMVDIEELLANPLQTDYRKLANKPKMAEGGSIDDLLALLNQKG